MQLYIGTVYRNNNFGKTGCIEVMLHQMLKYTGMERTYSNPICDILEDYKEALTMAPTYSNSGKLVQDCLVMGGNGNGYNAGMVQIPQVGSVGIVADVEDPELFSGIKNIWLGGLYGYNLFNQKVKLPNDDTESDDLEYDDKSLTVDEENGDVIDSSKYITDGQFIIKTKTCNVSDLNTVTGDDVDWKKIPGENTFVLNKTKSALRHNVNEQGKRKGLTQLILDDDKINIKRKIKVSSSSIREQDITIDDSQILINNTDGENTTTISLDAAGNLSISTTGNTTVDTKGDVTINSEGNTTVASQGDLNLTSKGMMTIEANGQNLATIIDDFAEDVKNLTTQGSPATHATTPASMATITKIQTNLGMGFNK